MEELSSLLLSPVSLYALMVIGMSVTAVACIELRTIFLRARAELGGLAAALQEHDKIDFAAHYPSYRRLALATKFGRDRWLEFESMLMFPRAFDANPVIRASQPPNRHINQETVSHSYRDSNLLSLIPPLQKFFIIFGAVFCVAIPLALVLDPSLSRLAESSIGFAWLGKGIKSFILLGCIWAAMKALWGASCYAFERAIEPYVNEFVFQLSGRIEYLSVQQTQFYTLHEQRQHTDALRSLVDRLSEFANGSASVAERANRPARPPMPDEIAAENDALDLGPARPTATLKKQDTPRPQASVIDPRLQ